MTVAASTKRIKSAERVLYILEYFNDRRREATVTDISRAYDLPQSSTSELLKTLTSLGYLAYDRCRRVYRPTARVAFLGAWVQPALFRCGKLLTMMDELSNASGELIVAGMQVGLSIRYIHAIQSKKVINTIIPDCSSFPLHTAMGRALLSTMPTEIVRKLVHRVNAESAARWRMPPQEFLAVLEEVRERRYAKTCDSVWRNGGMVCIALPDMGDGQRLGIGIGGESECIRRNAASLAALLHQAVERHLGARSPIPAEAVTAKLFS
jgi:DNA-binding IclR family transcriptional regulator